MYSRQGHSALLAVFFNPVFLDCLTRDSNAI